MTQSSATGAPKPKATLADLFTQIETLRSDCVHYHDGFRTWKRRYDEVALAARKFAADLTQNGIGQADKVIFWCENRPEWLAALWGCLISGVIVVPLDFRSSAEFVARVQRITNARLILTGEETSAASFSACPVWRLDEFEWPGESAARTIPPRPSVAIRPEDIAEIVFTSGSTGEPKGVVLTHRNILSSIIGVEPALLRYKRYIRYAEPVRVLDLLPLSHMFGQSLAAFGPPLVPACVVFMKSYSPQEIIRRIREEKILAAVLVPKMLESLMEYVAPRFTAKGDQLSRLRRVWRHRKLHWAFGLKFWAFIVGGAALETEVEDFWARRGFFVIQGYGLTETAPIVSFNDPSSPKRGSVGRTLPGVEVKIAPDGEILVRGENVTAGYFGSPEETQRAFTPDGWFHTGDFGELDSTGHLTIHGRKKELIVTAEGLNVVPEDVEHVLDSIPGVRESAVVGPDRVRAVMVLEPGVNLDDVVREANQKLEPRQRIREAVQWPGPLLPRTEATGKIKRFAVLDWLERGREKAAGEGAPAAAPARNPLYDLLAKYAPGRRITDETTLDELGLSSLDRVELMIDVEKTLGTQIDESSFAANRKAGELLTAPRPVGEVKFPEWADSPILRTVRAVTQPVFLLPLTRVFVDLEVSGVENLPASSGPLILAANHQSHMDTPSILAALPARRRNKVAVAMWKEYFAAHFHPERFPLSERWTTTLLYVLACGAFHGFPLPQTEMETSQALRYMGKLVNRGESILIFPEGGRSESGEIRRFLPGVGMLASRLHLPVVPVRLRGLNDVLPPSARFPRRGPVQVRFGKPLELKGRDYGELAREVEEAVRAL